MTRCAAKTKAGERCRAPAVTGGTRCRVHAVGGAVVQCTARTKSGERCRRPALRGAVVCSWHGAAAPQVKRAALERAATSPAALDAEAKRLLEGGLDELAQLEGLLALAFAAVSRIEREASGEPCVACGRSGDVVLLGAWLSSLEKWAARAESIAVSLRKMRTDARFFSLAEEIVQFDVTWTLKHIPPHRHEVAVRELEEWLGRVRSIEPPLTPEKVRTGARR